MRIISGKFKGKKLFHPTDEKTRPLKDLVKESIFNLIVHSKDFNFNLSDKRLFLIYFLVLDHLESNAFLEEQNLPHL